MNPHTIAVLNQKGGVGKSTIATNIAAAAHLAGRRTILLDLDKQGSAADWSAERAAGSRLSGIACAQADRETSLPALRKLSRGYDVVICDGPPRIDRVTLAAAVAADVVIVPLRVGVFDYWAAAETLRLLDEADEARVPRAPAARLLILNGATSARVTQHAIRTIEEMGERTPIVVIGSRVHFVEASLCGESVLTFAPTGAAAREIAALFALVAPRAEAA